MISPDTPLNVGRSKRHQRMWLTQVKFQVPSNTYHRNPSYAVDLASSAPGVPGGAEHGILELRGPGGAACSYGFGFVRDSRPASVGFVRDLLAYVHILSQPLEASVAVRCILSSRGAPLLQNSMGNITESAGSYRHFSRSNGS